MATKVRLKFFLPLPKCIDPSWVNSPYRQSTHKRLIYILRYFINSSYLFFKSSV
jgi:hypothetical protein